MRKKLTFLNTLFSGLVLVLFGLTSYQYLDSDGIKNIDEETFLFAHRELNGLHPMIHWRTIETSPTLESGRIMQHIAFHVKSKGGVFTHTSGNWPDAIDPSLINYPEIHAGFPGPIPDQEHRPPHPQGPPQIDQDQPRRGPSRMGPRPHRPPPPIPSSRPFNRECDGITWRVTAFSSPRAQLVICYDLSQHKQAMHKVGYIMLLATPIALLLIAIGSWFTASRAVNSISLLSRAMQRITASGLDSRVSNLKADRELQELIYVFNNMLDRLERSFNQAIRFSGDAAHELKTPVTILQGQLEQVLRKLPDGSEQQAQIADLLVQVARLNRSIRNLLMLARMDAGSMMLKKETVNIADIVLEQTEDIEVLDDSLTVKLDIPKKVIIQADPGLIRHLTSNLITNAVKYNRKSGVIKIVINSMGNEVRIEISNTGPGIKTEDQAFIFQRFYRVQQSEASVTEGSGLGLSIAREAALIHGGDVQLVSSDDMLTIFRVTLPIS